MQADSAKLVAVSWLVRVGLVLLAPGTATASDWPQYRGPTHDAVSTERINRNWTGSVTNAVWTTYLTNGVTSLSVSGGRVFTQIAANANGGNREFCIALSATNGAMLWATKVDDNASYTGGVGFTDDGPRSTPTVDGGSVFVLTSYLNLLRLNAANGAVIWQTNLLAGFGGSVIDWQNAASPTLESGLIFVNANCGTSTIMAFNSTNGALVWRSQNEAMTHATPVLATIEGVRQLIFGTQSGLVGLDPQNGNLLWKFPFEYNGISLGASPAVCGNVVCMTSDYGYGGAAAQITYANSIFTASGLWTNSAQDSHWATPVSFQGCYFGQFSPDDETAELRCIDSLTGNTLWAQGGFGRGATLLAGTYLLVITELGELVLVEANTNAYVELGRFTAIPNIHPFYNKCWNALALSDGQVYVRSTAYAARFDLSLPDLKLETPQLSSANKLQLTIRTATGSPVDSSRLAGMEVRASTNAVLSPAAWPKLTNVLVLTNGIVSVTNVDASPPRRFFIVTEPK